MDIVEECCQVEQANVGPIPIVLYHHSMHTIVCFYIASPCFGIFCTILDTVEARNSVNSVAVFSFLKAGMFTRMN